MKSDKEYEYSSLNDSEPLILVKSSGRPIGAMRIDRETGEFSNAATVSSLIGTSPDIDEVSERRFFQLVDQFRKNLSSPD